MKKGPKLVKCHGQNNSMHINDVKIFPLKKIEDERGAVMHMLRSNQDHFQGCGEIYFSLVKSKVIKGWKLHKRINQSMAVPEGNMRIVIYDPRVDSSTFGSFQVVDFGTDNYILLQLPPLVWYAFQAISKDHSTIVNCTTEPHDPLESEILPLETSLIPFDWSQKIFA